MYDKKNEMPAPENGMLRLARELTHGLCRVGPGPFGFGVHNCRLSQLGCVICLDPDPYGDMELPDGVDEFTVTLKPVYNDYSGRHEESVSGETLLELAENSDPATHMVAQALLKLSETTVTVSSQENNDAFDSMADSELKHGGSLTDAEASSLCGLRWYEGMTPEEIVAFQLFEERLCMPFEEFRSAVEAVFGRSVEPDELQFNKQLLQAEYREKDLSHPSQCALERQDPRGGLASLTL